MDNRYKDFDAFWAEKEQVPLTIKVLGKEYELPPALPAGLVLQILRAQAAGGGKIPPTVVLEMAESLFGAEALAEWQGKKLTIDQLGDMLKWAIDAYNGTDGEEKDPT